MAVTKITGAGLGLPNADGNALGGTSNEWSDLYLADSGIIYFGNDQDVTLTHVADTGILLNSTMAIQFNDSSQYINAPSATVLDINATDEIELNATLVDINANVEISGTATTTGVHTFTAVPVFPNNTVETADIQADAITGAKIADDAIDSEHYTDGSIDNAHIADNAIDSEHYADGSIDNAHIADDAIDSEHYADGSIDNAHIADDAIDSEHYADGSIDSAHLADDAVTLAKMASGTDGNIISYDASGNPVAIATGSDGQVLTSTGAGSPPAFEAAAGGGAWTLIGTVAASNSATLTVTGLDTTYDAYAVVGTDIIAASSSILKLKMGDSGGLESGWDFMRAEVNDGNANFTSSVDYNYAEIQMTRGAINSSYEAQFFGIISRGSTYPSIRGQVGHIHNDSNHKYALNEFGGMRRAAMTLTQVQILMDSGNITTGRLTVWGIAHA